MSDISHLVYHGNISTYKIQSKFKIHDQYHLVEQNKFSVTGSVSVVSFIILKKWKHDEEITDVQKPVVIIGKKKFDYTKMSVFWDYPAVLHGISASCCT